LHTKNNVSVTYFARTDPQNHLNVDVSKHFQANEPHSGCAACLALSKCYSVIVALNAPHIGIQRTVTTVCGAVISKRA